MADTRNRATAASSPIQSIDRAVALLNVIGSVGSAGIPLGALADEVGLHASTARTLLQALIAHGFVDQHTRTRQYRLGPAVFELNRRYAAQSDLSAVAAPTIRRLWEETRETVHLSVLQSGRRVDLAVLVSPQLLNVNPGSDQPGPRSSDSAWAGSLLTTAAGKVLLFGLTEDERAAHLSELRDVATPRGPRTVTAALADLARAEQAGYATNDEEQELGVCGVAAPVYDHARAVQAALCIGYPSVRRSAEYERQLIVAVQAAAAEISSALGAPEPGLVEGDEAGA